VAKRRASAATAKLNGSFGGKNGARRRSEGRRADQKHDEGSGTDATPSAAKKCQSSGLPGPDPSKLTLLARAGFLAAFFGLELYGISWGVRAPDRVLGFQMFNESSRVTIRLYREVKKKRHRVLVPIENGRWSAPDANGKLRHHDWFSRIQAEPLYVLNQDMHAPYGLKAQLFRLQAALDDMAAHIPDDTVTLALVAKVDTIHNGRPGPTVRLRADKP
jgi:hypothetical protein